MSKKNKKIRHISLIVLVIILFGFCVFRVVQFQVVYGEQNLALANKKIVNKIRQIAPRGEILDSKNNLLATNKTGFNIMFDSVFMKPENQNRTIQALLKIMNDNKIDWVAKKEGVSETKQIEQICLDMKEKDFSIINPYVFAQDIPIEVVGIIEEQSFSQLGVYIDQTAIREYLSEDIAPHIIGNIGFIFKEEYKALKKENYKLSDLIGRDGVEKAFERYLRGKDGYKEIIQNQKGKVVQVKNDVKPEAGNDIVLTINKDFQKGIQELLKTQIEKSPKRNGYKSKAGAAVVLDVKNGDVLAAATYPSYNINSYKTEYKTLSKNQDLPLFNRAINGEYRPGSTYKTSVALASLCEKIIEQDSTVFCSKRYTFWGNNKLCPTCLGFHRDINVTNALKVSCNIFFYDVGRRLGIEKENEYSMKLGLGVDTGLEIKSKTGRLSTKEYRLEMGQNWQNADIAQASIGQLDNSVTVLQMATQAMTIANKGKRYETHIVKSVLNHTTRNVVFQTKPVIASEIVGKEKEFEIVKEGMILAAKNIHGTYKIPNVAIKTGTPQTTNSKRFNSAVIGFAPADNPKIAFAVMLEDGENSKNMVKEIIELYNTIYKNL